ncbi:MAG TPA: CHRD domain-containing protein [Gaiellaceae bacterium]|nr:CHRD domain-containing protein [Gaiellaceae bacterium]
MKARYAVPALIAGAALTATGIAAAWSRQQATQAASATFAATTVSQLRSNTCTGSDGTYQDTNAVYTGTATSSNAQLSGSLEIRAHSVVNTTEGLGWLDGTFRVHPASGDGVNASFHAAIANGNLTGLATAGAHDGGKLVASLSSTFTQSGGFTSGNLGTGSATNTGVFFTQGSCTTVKQVKGTYVSPLGLNPREVVPPVTGLRASANGNVTFDVTRDSSGNVTGGTVVFYVNYDFPGSVTITGLTLNQGNRGTNGLKVVDANTGTFTDADGHGNVTKVVTGVTGPTLTSILSNPHGYYVTLTTSANPNGALRDQLESPQRR